MRQIFSLIKSVFYVLMIAVTYYIKGHQANEYLGYKQIEIGGLNIIILILTVFFGAYLFLRKYKKPSDYFLLLYGMIVVIPYCVLHEIYIGNDVNVVASLVLIFLPFAVVALLSSLNIKIANMPVISQDGLMRLIFAFSVIVVCALLINPPLTASFSLLDSYTRRLEARDVYGNGTFFAYMAALVMNAILPLIVFFGVLRKEIGYIAVGMILYLCIYYIYGVKAPVMYMLFFGVFAYYLRFPSGGEFFYNSIYRIFVSIFIFSWVEFLVFDYSYVEDYIIRRIYYVGSYLIGVYFDALTANDYSWNAGLATEKAASMYIGEDFLGLPDANANTNTFLYFLLQYGLGGYLFSILIVGGFLLILNSCRFRSDVFAFLSLMYAVLVLEQSATTALLSSGVGVVFFLFYFSRAGANLHKQ